MALLPISTDISSRLKKSIEPILTLRTAGQQLKHDLGLGKFPYVMVQKVIDVPINILVVTVDSRRPTVYLSPFRVKSSDSSRLLKVKHYGMAFLAKDYKLTPPLLIERTSPFVGLGTLFIFRDLGGEYLKNSKMYESEEYIVLDYNLD